MKRWGGALLLGLLLLVPALAWPQQSTQGPIQYSPNCAISLRYGTMAVCRDTTLNSWFHWDASVNHFVPDTTNALFNVLDYGATGVASGISCTVVGATLTCSNTSGFLAGQHILVSNAGTGPQNAPAAPVITIRYATPITNSTTNWAANHVYAANAVIQPVLHNYVRPASCYAVKTAGTSGAGTAQPNWLVSAPNLGDTVVDNGVTWIRVPCNNNTSAATDWQQLIQWPLNLVIKPATNNASGHYYMVTTAGFGDKTANQPNWDSSCPNVGDTCTDLNAVFTRVDGSNLSTKSYIAECRYYAADTYGGDYSPASAASASAVQYGTLNATTNYFEIADSTATFPEQCYYSSDAGSTWTQATRSPSNTGASHYTVSRAGGLTFTSGINVGLVAPSWVPAVADSTSSSDWLPTTVKAVSPASITMNGSSSGANTVTVYHDDTAAINAAYVAADTPSYNSVMYPTGTYNTCGAVISGQYIDSIGSGRGRTLIRDFCKTGNGMFVLNPTGTAVPGSVANPTTHIRDMAFNGQTIAPAGLYVGVLAQVAAKTLTISRIDGDAVSLKGTQNSTFSDIEITNSNSCYGLHDDGVSLASETNTVQQGECYGAWKYWLYEDASVGVQLYNKTVGKMNWENVPAFAMASEKLSLNGSGGGSNNFSDVQFVANTIGDGLLTQLINIGTNETSGNDHLNDDTFQVTSGKGIAALKNQVTGVSLGVSVDRPRFAGWSAGAYLINDTAGAQAEVWLPNIGFNQMTVTDANYVVGWNDKCINNTPGPLCNNNNGVRWMAALSRGVARSLTSADCPYTVVPDDSILQIDVTAANCTVNLPANLGFNREIRIGMTFTSGSPHIVTVTPPGGSTIDGAATQIMGFIGESETYDDRSSTVWTSVARGFSQSSGAVVTGDLPTCATGLAIKRALVTDSNTAATANYWATFAGGGANKIWAACDNANWRID